MREGAPGTVLEPRPTCMRCGRPSVVCRCAAWPLLSTRTRVVLLQHPREASVAIGTAKMAHACLADSELRVGLTWDEETLQFVHRDAGRPAMLLYPGDGAVDLETHPPSQPITLVVIDGTWAQTKKLVRENAALRALPRVAFRPREKSIYQIRREPHDEYVSTIEALAHALGVLEQDAALFAQLLAPFRDMIDVQLGYVAHVHAPRSKRPRQKLPRGVPLPEAFRSARDQLVVLVAESNAWPFGTEERARSPHGRLMHLCAARVSTGATLELFAQPGEPLAPNTLKHLGLTEEVLASGLDEAELRARWASFVRPEDVLVSWGPFSLDVLRAAGCVLPAHSVDARLVARVQENASVGSLTGYAGDSSPLGHGRAGLRLGALRTVVERWSGPLPNLPGR